MTDALVQKIESPWARAVRSFLSSLASSPVLAALLVQFTTVQAVKDGLVPVAIIFISALLIGASALALGYSERYRALTDSPWSKGIAQALQVIGIGIGTISIASIDPDVLVSVGDSFVALVVQGIFSGILTAALAGAQEPSTEPVEG